MAQLSGFNRPPDPIEVQQLIQHLADETGLVITWVTITTSDVIITGTISEANRTALQAALDSYVYTAPTSLQGPPGPEGPQGPQGMSTYTIWLNRGNTGTHQDFLDSLKGADGAPGSGSSDWADITNKPSTFTPSAHSHVVGDTTGLQTALDAKAPLASPTFTGTVSGVTKTHVGLSNVDNTSDANKPISTATQAALDAKAATGHNHDAAYEAKNTNIQAHIVSTHAPSDAQKNSDITKAEIEAKLTGQISTHTHAAANDSRITTAQKSAPQSFTGAVTDVTGLGLSLLASSTYYVYYVIPITTSTGTTPTLALSFTGPASPTLVSLRRAQMTAATTLAFSSITSFTAFAAGASVANTYHTIEGIVVTSAGNAGTMQLRATAAGTTPNITIGVGASAYAIKTA